MNDAIQKQIQKVLSTKRFKAIHFERFTRLYGMLEMHGYGLGVFDLLDAAVKYPQLLCSVPETLNRNAEVSATLLGITKQAFVAAAMKQPSLFRRKPETLGVNADNSASLLGITKQAFVAAALKQPSLFGQMPEKLDGNAAGSASLLGITKQAFIAAALKQPQLLCLNPETLALKKSYLLKIQEALNDRSSFESFVVHQPSALCCGTGRLHACYVLAKLDLKRGSPGSLVCFPARDAERLLLRHYGERIATTGRGARPLQIMHAMGIIKSLPAGISPISRPGRVRNPPCIQSKCSQAKLG
jgi:F0F1-type ATP synthase membrane subunit c/vacuolar-type H+-ATPase subunit K